MGRLAISELTTYRWSFEEDVRQYALAGVSGVGVWRQKLSDFGEEKGAELIAEMGLRASSLLWAGGFTGSDGRSYKESVEDGLEAIRVAALLEAPALIVYSGSRAGHTLNHARRLFRNGLRELAPLASERNVILAVEPMHKGCAAEWTFLTDLQDAWNLVAELESPHVKLVFDTYHWALDEASWENLAAMAPDIALVQLGDAKTPPEGEQNRCPLGEGVAPLKRIVAELERGGYRGWYEVELLGEEIEATTYDDLLAASRRRFDQLLGAAAADGEA